MKVLSKSFFSRPARTVAEELPGKFLERRVGRTTLRALIVAAEAFDGSDGRPTRDGMKHAPGHIFVMKFRGFRFLNLCTEREGVPSCVMISAIVLDGRIVEGPGRVSRALQIEDNLEGQPLGEALVARESPVSFTASPVRSRDRSENSEGIFRLDRKWVDAHLTG